MSRTVVLFAYPDCQLVLSLAATDHGPTLAGRVARELVMFLRRPGGQSQFSEALARQARADGALRRVVDAVHADPGGARDLQSMANLAAVTPRYLSRPFRRCLQTMPGAYLARVRLERTRACLLEGERAPPSVYRERFGSGFAQTGVQA